jgi:hypothetical protein
VVWGLCFGKTGGVKSFLVGLSGGIVGQGHSVPLTRPVSASSIYAAIVYVLGSNSPISLSLSPPLPEDLRPWTILQHYLA